MAGRTVGHLFAFLGVNPESGDEGVVSYFDPKRGTFPLIASDWERVEALKPIAQDLADAEGLDITIAKFSVRLDGQKIHPQPGRGKQ